MKAAVIFRGSTVNLVEFGTGEKKSKQWIEEVSLVDMDSLSPLSMRIRRPESQGAPEKRTLEVGKPVWARFVTEPGKYTQDLVLQDLVPMTPDEIRANLGMLAGVLGEATTEKKAVKG